MSRPVRIQYAGAYYHVACRGNERRAIFRDDVDRRTFLERLERSVNSYGVRLLCYVLMRNHYHLLVQTPKPNLSEFMMHFNGGYTMAFNRRHRRSGHLYQGRYHAVVIERDSYLLEASRYLHLNAVRVRGVAGRNAGERAAVLSRHRWSSYPGYVSVRGRKSFVDYSEVLAFFGGETAQARRGYADFVLDGIQQGCANPFRDVVGQLMLGGGEFLDRMKARFLSGGGERRERPSLRAISEIEEPELVLGVVSEVLGVGIEPLTARGRNSIERGLAMEAVYRCCGLTQPQIGKLFGGVDYSTVSVSRKRFLERMERDKRLRNTFTRTMKELGIIQE